MKLIILVTVFLCLLVTVEAGDKALGGDCTFDNGGRSDCADANAVCTPQTTPKCVCKTGYEKAGTICIAVHTIGAACTSTDGSKGDCSDVNAICPTASKKCECKSGYTGTTGGTCAVNNKGSAPAQMSMWMLCMTVMGMSLAVYVV